jgi:Leucine-rich repeat (LRR) protein
LINLKKLDLTSNRIGLVRAACFRGLDGLRELNLSHNRIQFANETHFSGLKSLKSLNLAYNPRNSMSSGGSQVFFATLNSLEILNLGHLVHRGVVEEEVIGRLERIIFRPLVSTLRKLDLAFSGVNVIESGFFKSLPHLVYLNLSGNEVRFGGSVGVFEDLKALRYLDLGANRLGDDRMRSNVFVGLDSLETLHLDSNKLKKLDESWFNGLTGLRQLNLGANELGFFNFDVLEKLVNLREVCLDGNSGDGFEANIEFVRGVLRQSNVMETVIKRKKVF